MSQPFPAQPSAPKPGPPVAPAAPDRASIDPAQIGQAVGEYVEQVDALRRSAQDAGDIDADRGIDLSTLDAQAELLERAHDVLTRTLEQLDRV